MKYNEFMDMTADDFEDMSAADLEKLQQQASAWREELKAQARVLVGVLDKKLTAAQTILRFEQMTDAEKAALIQHVKEAGGIDSGEAFGKP